ncbi:Protein of unknown function- DUF584 [Striga hermonthica]|uniref:Senescence regulator n=1 Tax=Striga hermonthica TaxID=68872 RepID=A0A9N7N8S0_STRHE|nr:Protein of unknown function- DUF584 [Striga hermonthica]
MAKGRKLATSRSERFLGSFGRGPEQRAVAGDGYPELGEDEVWSMIDGASVGGNTHSPAREWSSRASADGVEGFIGYGMGRPPAAAAADRHRRRQAGGLSLAFDDSGGDGDKGSLPRIVHQFRAPEGKADSPRGRHVATSAPVNVPDWSKIYRVESVESLHDSDDGLNDYSEIVPPHEYLARSRKMAANSVFEGVGRTLKGRDLSRVRDAVWSQTGFYG